MKQDDEEISDGLNELFEIINAKGDTGELKEILDSYDSAKLEDNQKANYKRPRE
ncbi:hypothetical protein [Neobacillus drentensis]|uniref:hypothetical protein n=1 Tax=Neobacillus drentensis TaxID=220684 RepID=UPI000A7CF17B|nr:hypothetical protein [Neobacillus drentensis]